MRNRGKLTANRLAGGGDREERGRIRVETAEYRGGGVAAGKDGRNRRRGAGRVSSRAIALASEQLDAHANGL